MRINTFMHEKKAYNFEIGIVYNLKAIHFHFGYYEISFNWN